MKVKTSDVFGQRLRRAQFEVSEQRQLCIRTFVSSTTVIMHQYSLAKARTMEIS